MYRLYQDNTNNRSRPDDGDDVAVPPVPAPFYGDDQYSENGIPFHVTVQQQPVGDEPSALGDGSAMAYHREFEDLWRLLEAEALRNGWKHITPAQTAGDDDDDDDAGEEITEFGINSIPPVIHDALVNEPDVPVQSMADNMRARLSFESSNNETTLHANIDEIFDIRRGQSSGQNPREPSRCAPIAPVSSNNLPADEEEEIPPLDGRTRRESLDDDPGPPLSQVARCRSPPRRARAPVDEWQTLPSSLTQERARYISAGIIKPSKNTHLGIELKANRDGTIEIERIQSDGFLFVSGTPLKVGDIITGIRTTKATYACGHVGGMRKNDVLRLLKKSVGRITIVAENPTGASERIECMTSKPHPEFGTGIFFLSGSPGSKILQIHSVPANGLFANSLLHRGARVISINGVDCSELDACVATDIVKSSPRYVSIVAQTDRMSSTVDYAVDPAAHLRSVPEAGDERRSSFGMFRRRGGANNPMGVGSEHSPRSVDC